MKIFQPTKTVLQYAVNSAYLTVPHAQTVCKCVVTGNYTVLNNEEAESYLNFFLDFYDPETKAKFIKYRSLYTIRFTLDEVKQDREDYLKYKHRIYREVLLFIKANCLEYYNSLTLPKLKYKGEEESCMYEVEGFYHAFEEFKKRSPKSSFEPEEGMEITQYRDIVFKRLRNIL
jgi:hypothetical protein